MCPPMRAHWRHLANRVTLCILRPTGVRNQNGKWIGWAVFARLTTESAYTLQWAPLSTRIAPPMGDLDLPCNTWCFRPIRVHNPNGTSIGSAVFAQMTAECFYTLQRFACFPLKIVPSHVGIWTSCNTRFIGPTRVRNANGNLIISALFAGLTSVTDWQSDRKTDRPRYSVRGGVIMHNYVGYGKATQSFHVSTNNFTTIKSLPVRLKHLIKYLV